MELLFLLSWFNQDSFAFLSLMWHSILRIMTFRKAHSTLNFRILPGPPLYRHGWLFWWLISGCIVPCTKALSISHIVVFLVWSTLTLNYIVCLSIMMHGPQEIRHSNQALYCQEPVISSSRWRQRPDFTLKNDKFFPTRSQRSSWSTR